MNDQTAMIRWFSDLNRSDTAIVGGKNSSLGEMIGKLKEAGINVPDGFATTADAYWSFLDANDLTDRIGTKLAELKTNGSNLPTIGKAVRKMVLDLGYMRKGGQRIDLESEFLDSFSMQIHFLRVQIRFLCETPFLSRPWQIPHPFLR